jgi:predicted dehydrogenase
MGKDGRRVGIGLVGAGFMGKCHAHAFRSVGGLFDLPCSVDLDMLADIDAETAKASASALGFRRSTGDWTELVRDPAIDIVAVTAPNKLHEPIVLAAAAEGKAIYCEKPLSTTALSAHRMRAAADEAGVLTLVGFNFLRNPMIKHARNLIQEGAIGEITSFRGRHVENYMASPDTPHSFRTDREGGGALADIGSHILSLARHLVGPITSVNGIVGTIFKDRPIAQGTKERKPVLVDDHAHALLRFDGGAIGSIEANWAATGRTMDLSFEVTGKSGAIAFSQERMNELLLYRADAPGSLAGFTRIESGPAHPPYDAFCPAPGHHLGFNDLKVIEVAELLDAYCNGKDCFPDFSEACHVQEIVDAIHLSAQQGIWVTMSR